MPPQMQRLRPSVEGMAFIRARIIHGLLGAWGESPHEGRVSHGVNCAAGAPMWSQASRTAHYSARSSVLHPHYNLAKESVCGRKALQNVAKRCIRTPMRGMRERRPLATVVSSQGWISILSAVYKSINACTTSGNNPSPGPLPGAPCTHGRRGEAMMDKDRKMMNRKNKRQSDTNNELIDSRY